MKQKTLDCRRYKPLLLVSLMFCMAIFLASFTSATITTTLNSPANNSVQLTNLVTFNATGSTDSGYLTNATLWTKVNTGSWGARNTTLLSLSTIETNPWNTGYITTNPYSTKHGMKIYSLYDNHITQIGKFANALDTHCYVLNSGKGVLATGTFSGNYCSIDYILLANTTYYIAGDGNGASVAHYRKDSGVSYNQAGTSIIWAGGLIEGNDDATKSADISNFTITGGYDYAQTFKNTYSSGNNILWNMQFCDSDGDCGFAPSNFTFTIDSQAPVITPVSGNGTQNYGTTSVNHTINYTVTDTNLAYCQLGYNGTIRDIDCYGTGIDTTNFALQNGVFNATIYGIDTAGNIGSTLIEWDYKVFENSRTYSSSIYATSTETFILNTSLSSATSIIGKLIYNGTEYTSSIVDGGLAIFTNVISIPSVSTSTNVSFYWSITLDGTTTINTTAVNQTINPISFSRCGGVYTNPFINFTSYSAENPFPMINATFKSAWVLSATDGGATSTYNFEDVTETNSSWAFCSQFNETLYASVEIEYDASGYALNFYYLDDAELSNSTQTIPLYILNDSRATVTTLKVLDDAQQPLEDVTIQIQFYDIGTGTFYLIGMGKTDFKGEDIAYLNWYDTLYRFTFIKDGVVIKSTNTTKISSTPVTFNVLEDETFLYKKFQDFIYSLTFNNLTNNFVLTFTKPSGLVDQGCLRVIKRTGKNDTEICFSCETSSSATLYCNLNDAGNGTFIAHFYATGSWYDLDWITEVIGFKFSDTIYDLLGADDATFYAFIFAGIVTFMMFIHPIFGIVGVLLGILGANILGFAPIDYGIFMGIILIGGTIIWIIKR